MIPWLKELNLSLVMKGDFFELYFKNSRVLIGGQDEITRYCSKLYEGNPTRIKSLLDDLVKKGFVITEEKLAILKKQKEIIQKVLDNTTPIGNTTQGGNFGEIMTMYKFETSLIKLNGKEGMLRRVSNGVIDNLNKGFKKGIDGIFEFSSPPPHFIIVEAKYNTAKLSKEITKSRGSQMSEFWIEYDLLKGAVSPEIADDILMKGYETVLSTVSKKGEIALNTINQTTTTASKGGVWSAIFY